MSKMYINTMSIFVSRLNDEIYTRSCSNYPVVFVVPTLQLDVHYLIVTKTLLRAHTLHAHITI